MSSAQLSPAVIGSVQFSSVYSQISFARKGQLREARLSNSILSQISFAQNNLELEIPNGVLHANIDLDMVTGLWLTHILNFGFLSWFLRCKEHPCPLSSDLELWRTLEVPDWGLAS